MLKLLIQLIALAATTFALNWALAQENIPGVGDDQDAHTHNPSATAGRAHPNDPGCCHNNNSNIGDSTNPSVIHRVNAIANPGRTPAPSRRGSRTTDSI